MTTYFYCDMFHVLLGTCWDTFFSFFFFNILSCYIQSFLLLDKSPIMLQISLREHDIRFYLISIFLSDILCHWQDYHHPSLFPLLKCSGLNLASWVLIRLSRLEGVFFECCNLSHWRQSFQTVNLPIYLSLTELSYLQLGWLSNWENI